MLSLTGAVQLREGNQLCPRTSAVSPATTLWPGGFSSSAGEEGGPISVPGCGCPGSPGRRPASPAATPMAKAHPAHAAPASPTLRRSPIPSPWSSLPVMSSPPSSSLIEGTDNQGDTVARLRLQISMSLDGFIAGPNQSEENPLGEGGMQLHQWAFALE